MSHTPCYCNNGRACFEAGGDALKCCVSARCSLGRTQFKTDQVCLSWPGPPCALCPCPPFSLQHRGGRKIWKPRRRETRIGELSVWFLTSKIRRTPPIVPAGSDIESRVGGPTVGQAVRCKTLLGLRQQLWAGLLQIILAARRRPRSLMWSPAVRFCFALAAFFQWQVRDFYVQRRRAAAALLPHAIL